VDFSPHHLRHRRSRHRWRGRVFDRAPWTARLSAAAACLRRR